MKVVDFENPVTNTWLTLEGHRLDAPPFLSGAVEAKVRLEKLHAPKQSLKVVTQGGLRGIYNGPQFSRAYVQSREYGVPFVGSSSMLQSDLSGLPLISKKSAYSPKLRDLELREGMTLISCSGTIGRMVYVRPEMQGMWSSQHMMKVVPDPEVIPPGYLYAYLSSKYGKTLITSGTYGAIIQHIEPEHIADLPVPRFGAEFEGRVHELVRKAGQLRSEANMLNRNAVEMFANELRLPQPTIANSKTHVISSSRVVFRLDAFYFSDLNESVRQDLDATPFESRPMGDVAEIFIPGIFKRLYASDKAFGVPYITGGNVFQSSPDSEAYLLHRVARENRLVLQKGMTVIQEAGQLGGLIGRSVFLGERLADFACSNNMVRVTANNSEDSGYLFAFISSEYGYRLISRESAGSSIPHLEVGRIRNIMIPWPDDEVRRRIGEPVMEAVEKSDQGWRYENEARRLVEQAIESDFQG